MIITDIQQQKYRKNMYSIFIDCKYAFSIEDIELLKLNLKIDQVVSNDQLEFYIKTYELTRAKEKALNFVSFKPRTSSEVIKKLKGLDFSDNTIDTVISYLSENKYLDDEKYTEMFINDQIKFKAASKRAIRQKLSQKGIHSTLSEQKLQETEVDEYSLALNLVEKKAAKIKIMDKKELSKLYGMLIRKGFSHEVSIKAVKNLSSKG